MVGHGGRRIRSRRLGGERPIAGPVGHSRPLVDPAFVLIVGVDVDRARCARGARDGADRRDGWRQHLKIAIVDRLDALATVRMDGVAADCVVKRIESLYAHSVATVKRDEITVSKVGAANVDPLRRSTSIDVDAMEAVSDRISSCHVGTNKIPFDNVISSDGKDAITPIAGDHVPLARIEAADDGAE